MAAEVARGVVRVRGRVRRPEGCGLSACRGRLFARGRGRCRRRCGGSSGFARGQRGSRGVGRQFAGSSGRRRYAGSSSSVRGRRGYAGSSGSSGGSSPTRQRARIILRRRRRVCVRKRGRAEGAVERGRSRLAECKRVRWIRRARATIYIQSTIKFENKTM
ncbi:hypothetical protein BD413DRAFT_104455 [Trametes elegans]|nr:hypothetical protein BD413DRAFT_104455 [Trametes elegans]